METTNEFLAIFLEEAQSRLNDMEEAIKSLKNGDFSAQEKIRVSAHTLKGMALQMGFENTSKLPKQIEHLFIKLKNTNKNITKETIDIVEECFLKIKDNFERIKNTGTDESNTDELEEKIEKLTQKL